MKKKLILFDRTEEIYNELPKEYRDIIFNNLISKSIAENKFADELSLYINHEEVERILLKLDIGFKKTLKKRVVKKDNYIKDIKEDERKDKDNEDCFTY